MVPAPAAPEAPSSSGSPAVQRRPLHCSLGRGLGKNGLSSWSPGRDLQSPAPRRTWSPGWRTEGGRIPQAGRAPWEAFSRRSEPLPALSGTSTGDSDPLRVWTFPATEAPLAPSTSSAGEPDGHHRAGPVCFCAQYAWCRHTVGARTYPPSEGGLDVSGQDVSGPQCRGLGHWPPAALGSSCLPSVSTSRANPGSPSVCEEVTRPDQAPRPPESVRKRPASGSRCLASPLLRSPLQGAQVVADPQINGTR